MTAPSRFFYSGSRLILYFTPLCCRTRWNVFVYISHRLKQNTAKRFLPLRKALFVADMEVLNPCYSVLTNLEVMESLRSIKDTKKKYGLRNLATIAYETLQFLDGTPSKNQNRDGIAQFIKEIKPYKLTRAECLAMVNDPPNLPLHIQLLIEDSEERLTEDQVNEVLAIVVKYLIPSE